MVFGKQTVSDERNSSAIWAEESHQWKALYLFQIFQNQPRAANQKHPTDWILKNEGVGLMLSHMGSKSMQGARFAGQLSRSRVGFLGLGSTRVSLV